MHAGRERTRLESARKTAEYARQRTCNLDRKNPNAATDFEHLPPEQLADDILKKEQRIVEIMAEIKAQLAATS